MNWEAIAVISQLVAAVGVIITPPYVKDLFGDEFRRHVESNLMTRNRTPTQNRWVPSASADDYYPSLVFEQEKIDLLLRAKATL